MRSGRWISEGFEFGWHDSKSAVPILGEIGCSSSLLSWRLPKWIVRALIVPFFVCSCRIAAKELVRTIPSTAHICEAVSLFTKQWCCYLYLRIRDRIVKVYDSWKLGAFANLFFASFSSHLELQFSWWLQTIDIVLLLLDEGNEMEMSWATPTQFRTDDSCLFSSNSQVIRSVNKLFFRLRPLPSHYSPQFPSFSCVFAFALFYFTIFDFTWHLLASHYHHSPSFLPPTLNLSMDTQQPSN